MRLKLLLHKALNQPILSVLSRLLSYETPNQLTALAPSGPLINEIPNQLT